MAQNKTKTKSKPVVKSRPKPMSRKSGVTKGRNYSCGGKLK